jgi:hypothetical protein
MTAVTGLLTERKPPPRWWGYYLVVVSLVAVAGLGAGLIGLWQNDRNAEKQARCFGVFAGQFSAVSKEVRAAQVQTDEVEAAADAAAANRDAAFQDVLTLILSGNEDRKEGLRVFRILTEANAELVDQRQALVRARMELQQTRKEHPIPDAPDPGSDDCTLLD